MSAITVRPGETVTVIGLPAYVSGVGPSHPIALPGDPWWGGGGPVDPGYNPPGVGPGVPGTRPPIGSVDPGWGVTPPIPVDPGNPNPPSGPVDPGYFPPGIVAPPPNDNGYWVWAWLPGVGWRWVRVPGQGQAGPKK